MRVGSCMCSETYPKVVGALALPLVTEHTPERFVAISARFSPIRAISRLSPLVVDILTQIRIPN